MQKTVEENIKVAEAAMKDGQEAFKTASEKFAKGAEELTAFGKANLEALVKSGEISAKNGESLGTEIAEFSKKSFEDGMKAAYDLASAKTPTEFVEKQIAFAQPAFEAYGEQMTKISKLAMDNAQSAFAPIQERIKAAGEFKPTSLI